jgi:Tol biopolymer transport system component
VRHAFDGASYDGAVRAWCTGLALLALACGRVEIQRISSLDASALDAGPDAARDAAIPDAGIDAARDAGSDGGTDAGPEIFATPSPVSELNTASSESDASLTEDELEIFFASDRSGNAEIWTARRTSPIDPWGEASLVAELADPETETDPEISPDGLHLFFSSFRGGNNDVWESSRATRSSAWSAPVAIAELSSVEQECCVAISDDGLRVVLASNRLAAAETNLYAASRESLASPWGAPVLLTELNTERDESNPYWAAGERRLYFDSNRTGSMGLRDIFVAARPSIADPFGEAASIPEISSTADERDPWISRDERRIWFSSDRDGDYDIFVAER